MLLSYAERCAIPEAYEPLLLNALEGDATLFTRSDGIEAAWKTIDSILQVWDSDAVPPLANYEPGSCGPQSANELLAYHDRVWRYSCAKHDRIFRFPPYYLKQIHTGRAAL